MLTHTDIPHSLAAALLLTGGAVAGLAAQEHSTTPLQPAGPTPVLKPLDRLLNATVFVPARPAEAETGPPAKRENVGIVSNLVIDTQAQRITFAAVHTEDGARAVPFPSMSWDPGSHGWVLSSREELTRARAFDPQQLDALHTSVAEAGAAKQDASKQDATLRNDDVQRRAREKADQEKAGQSTPATPPAAPASGRYALATDAAKSEVAANDGRYATAVGIVIEARSGTLAFLRVPANGGDLAVPWTALQVQPVGANPGPPTFVVAMNKQRLEAAPRLDRDAASNLEDRAFRDRIYEYFTVTPPAFEPPLAATKQQ